MSGRDHEKEKAKEKESVPAKKDKQAPQEPQYKSGEVPPGKNEPLP